MNEIKVRKINNIITLYINENENNKVSKWPSNNIRYVKESEFDINDDFTLIVLKEEY